ncbi:MAG: FHA domain-containing protein [Bdellovibrionales bacterium]|nr:FHA domain-containing protein [Bdellovibrionales bacterium]
MWAIRILTGALAGKTYSLKEGDNYIGRGSQADIRLQSAGVSKDHCVITVNGNKVILLDKNSSNGTFVNGSKVVQKQLNNGDKIGIHDVLADVQYNVIPFPNMTQQTSNSFSAGNPNYSEEQNMYSQSPDLNQPTATKAPTNLKESIQVYVDNVVMPAVYRLIEVFEMKWVLGSFVLGFILLVTSLSMIPMMQITKRGIEKESQRRALTIARNIANINGRLLEQGLTGSLSVASASREEGVKLAVIVDAKNSQIIAPASKVGTFENNPFLNTIRSKPYEFVNNLGNSTIGASVPMQAYNADLQTATIAAYAVVIYDISALSIDDGQTLSLFVQTLAIALLLGYILFYFMYRIIEKPIFELNRSIDGAMKQTGSVTSKYVFPILQPLIVNINSLLNRTSSSAEGGGSFYVDRNSEAQNIVRLFEGPSFAVNKDLVIIDCNLSFENLTGIISGNIQQQGLDRLNDQALILSIQDLIERAKMQPNLIATNAIEFNGNSMELDVQAISSDKEIEYYIFSIKNGGVQ